MLETENFLAHKSVSLSFPDNGIFLLSGPSGSGKSSLIIDAMAYTLFGVVATRAKRQSDLFSSGENGAMSVRATFDFSADRRITIARGLDERGSSWAEVYSDGSLLAEGSAPVARFVRKELGGMIWQQFYAAFVARQSEIAMLTTLRGGERKNLVQRMLGMRELEKTAEVISENIRRFSAEIEQLEGGLSDDGSLREAEEVRLKEKIKSLREELSSSEHSLGIVKNQLAQIEAQIIPLEKVLDEQSKRKEMLAQLEGLQGQKKIMEGLASLQVEADQIENYQSQLDTLKAEQDNLREQYRLASDREKLETELSAIPSFDLNKSLAEREEALRDLQKEQKRLQDDISLFQKRGEDLERTGHCDLCRRPFQSEEEKELVAQEIAQELTRCLELSQQQEIEIKQYQKEMPLWKENEKHKVLHQNLKSELEDLPKLDTSSEEITLQGKELGKKIKELEEKVASCRVAEESNFKPQDLEDIENKISQILASLPEANDCSQELEALQNEKQKYEQRQGELAGKIIEIQKQIDAEEQSLQENHRAQQEWKSEAAKIDRVRSLLLAQQNLQDYLRGYQKHLAHEIRPALEEIGSEMMRRVSGGQHRAIHLDDNYEIELETSAGERIPASMISGGEAVRASICLRLALTRLVSSRTGVPVEFLILDEPLPAQDAGHIERIMELLQSLRPFYKQQFIISHVGNLSVSEEVDYLLQFDGSSVQLLRA